MKLSAETYIKSLSNDELKDMAKDCLLFWDLGIIPDGLFKTTIRDKRESGMIFSEGIQFIINILTHEIFSRSIKNLI